MERGRRRSIVENGEREKRKRSREWREKRKHSGGREEDGSK